MKRSLKVLLLAGVATGALVGAAAPAHAKTCAGVYRDQFEEHTGVWTCDSCPSSPVGLGDGRVWVMVCIGPE